MSGKYNGPAKEIRQLAVTWREHLAAELDNAVSFRHQLHAEAELSGAEQQTAATVAAALGGHDAPVIADTGRLVRIGPPAGPCVAIRAELDALPIREETGVSWSSRTAAMHACGHDVHLAALTALGRAARKTDLPVALVAVLQPREEMFPSGARDIVTDRAFTDHEPHAVIAVHLQPELGPGTAAAPPGIINAASDDFEIIVHGRGGHAGYPHLAANPIPALCHTLIALDQIPSRLVDPTHAVAVSVGALSSGQAPNVVPDRATARGSLRTLDPADRPALHKAVQDIAQHTCQAHGCQATVTITDGEPALINDQALAEACQGWLKDAGFETAAGFRSCGADDFSFYASSTPTLMIFLGTGGRAGLHHPSFLPGDETIGQAAEAMMAGYLAALTALPVLTDSTRRPVG